MTKWLNSFLEFKNEAEGTKRFALGAVVVITCGLALLSVTGVFATATWTWRGAVPIIAFALLVTGAEALAAVSFVRVLLAPTRNRKVFGALIFLGLAWIGVQNAKNGAHVVFPDRFAETSSSLAAQAALAGEEAALMGEAAKTAVASSGTELERVRTDIATLKAEQVMLSAQSPEGIAKAQSHLQSIGLYFGREDGISDILTERARRQRGEQIAEELKILKAREDGFMTGVASPVQSATTDKRLQEIATRDRAEQAFWNGVWLEVMLWVAEGARSLGLWVYVTAVTGSGIGRSRAREEELAEAEHANRLAELRGKKPPEPAPQSHPEPVHAVSEQETPPPPPEEPVNQGPRKGGRNSAQHKEAAKAANERLLILADRSAQSEAMKVAAE